MQLIPCAQKDPQEDSSDLTSVSQPLGHQLMLKSNLCTLFDSLDLAITKQAQESKAQTQHLARTEDQLKALLWTLETTRSESAPSVRLALSKL